MIGIINNKSKYIELIKSFLEFQKVQYQVFNHDDTNIPDKFSGFFLSGGPGNPLNSRFDISANYHVLDNFSVPIYGVCLGHEIIAQHFGGQLDQLASLNFKNEPIIFNANKNDIKDNLPNNIYMLKNHRYYVKVIPQDFVSLAYSPTCQIEMMKNKNKPIYSSQFHPEASGLEGMIIMNNFLKICGEVTKPITYPLLPQKYIY